MPSIDKFMLAIREQEGWFPGSRSQRNNNPGNVMGGYWANLYGGRVENGYDVFNSLADGYEALRRQIRTNINRGLTLFEFFAGKDGVYPGYASAAAGNRPDVYAVNVGKALNIPWNGVQLNSYQWVDEYLPETTGQTIVSGGAGTGSGTQVSMNVNGDVGAGMQSESEIGRIVDEALSQLRRDVTLPGLGKAVPLWWIVVGIAALAALGKGR